MKLGFRIALGFAGVLLISMWMTIVGDLVSSASSFSVFVGVVLLLSGLIVATVVVLWLLDSAFEFTFPREKK